jgi:hypothetical protein
MIEAKSVTLDAAADYLGPGAIETPIFEDEILDVVRRGSIALRRIRSKPATGHPHRYFEQLAIAAAAAVDPRNLQNTAATGPTRVERPAFIKAVTAQTNISLFDKEVTQQQGQFASVVAKDVDDVINAVEVKRSKMLWNGSDTSLSAPTTLEWMGFIPQIALTAGAFITYVAPGASIIDAIKTTTAQLVANQAFDVKPSALFMNPLLADYIDQEAKAAHIELKTKEVVAGTTVSMISTQCGDLPMICEAFMPTDTASAYGLTAPPASNKNYYCVISMESEVEIPVISGDSYNPNPRLFQLGLVGNLAGQFVGLKFDTLIVKGANYAHALVVVQRP